MSNQMSAQERKISEIFSLEHKEYVIPNYQRAYSWTSVQAEALFDDILDAFINDYEEYFLGSIITIENRHNKFDIVDGQQRLITLSIFFLSLRNFINMKFSSQNIDDIKNKIIERITNRSMRNENHIPKINVRTYDQHFYNSLIINGYNALNYEDDNIPDSQKKMFKNYSVFYDKLEHLEFSLDRFIHLYEYIINNISMVMINTNNVESSFRIFDVLNSRGLALTTIDLLKSKIFEKVFLHCRERTKELEEKWALLENKIGLDNMNGFYITHCLSKMTRNTLLFSNAVDNYEKRLDDTTYYKHNPLLMVEDLIRSANNYYDFFNKDAFCHTITQSLHIMSYITKSTRKTSKNSPYNIWVPPLLALKNRMDELNDPSDINMEKFKDFLKIYELFYMHMSLLKYNKAQIQNSYGNLIGYINNLEDFDKIKKELLSLLKNKDVEEVLKKDFKTNTPSVSQVLKGLLLKLNFQGSDEKYILLDLSNITLEHILPQKINNNYWRERYTERDHSVWVNKLGNFVLINKSKNSSAQNSHFTNKKEVYKNQTNSIFPLTRQILENSDWSLTDINKRHIMMLDLCKKYLLQFK